MLLVLLLVVTKCFFLLTAIYLQWCNIVSLLKSYYVEQLSNFSIIIIVIIIIIIIIIYYLLFIIIYLFIFIYFYFLFIFNLHLRPNGWYRVHIIEGCHVQLVGGNLFVRHTTVGTIGHSGGNERATSGGNGPRSSFNG